MCRAQREEANRLGCGQFAEPQGFEIVSDRKEAWLLYFLITKEPTKELTIGGGNRGRKCYLQP